MDSTCIICGGRMQLKNIRGEVWPYRDEPEVIVVMDYEMLWCQECGEGWLDETHTEALEAVLAESYRALKAESKTSG